MSYVSRQNAQLVNGNKNWSTSVQGVSGSYLSIRHWPVVAGRTFTDDEDREGAAVCVLGKTVVLNLFGEFSDPLGATVLVKNVPMVVIGVLAEKGHSASGQDQERVLGVASVSSVQTLQNNVFATIGPPPNPFGVGPKLEGFVNSIFVQARSPALDEVTKTLEREHRILPGKTDDFVVRDLTEIAEVADVNGGGSTPLLRTKF